MRARIMNDKFGGIYSVEFLEKNKDNEINGEIVSNWILTDVLPSNLIAPIWKNSKWEESLTEIEIEEINIKRLTDIEFSSYLKRKADGEKAYLKLSAEFRLAKLSGQISEEAHSYLEELLTPVRNEVMFGQWKKGLSILESLGVAQIGVDLYGRLHAQISNYIIENY